MQSHLKSTLVLKTYLKWGRIYSKIQVHKWGKQISSIHGSRLNEFGRSKMILLLKKKVCESELDEIVKQDSSLLPFHKGKVYLLAWPSIASE